MKTIIPDRRLALVLLAVLPSSIAWTQQTCTSLALQITDSSRQYCYTNKATAFLFGECLRQNQPGWEGFHVGNQKLLGDYTIHVNGILLDRSSSTVSVRPDQLVRSYPDGTRERILPFDSIAAFAVELVRPQPAVFELALGPGDGAFAVVPVILGGDSIVTIAPRSRPGPEDDRGRSLAVYAPGLLFKPTIEGAQHDPAAPVLLSSTAYQRLLIVFAAGDSPEEAAVLAHRCSSSIRELEQSRTLRLNSLLRRNRVCTGSHRFDLALAWAQLSLDALIMHQGGPGIFAGLPWFNNYWGRDTFIALPGATLVLGRFAEARAILSWFGGQQNSDSSSSDYGRIPNYIGPAGKAYNTADGTPRFVMMLRDYVERSGDTAFASQMYPVVRRSIEGSVQFHTDSLGFLVHGDAETWMDAVGPDGPWSPRGTRANDVQALWEAQLHAGIALATQVHDTASAREWERLRLRLRRSFLQHFVVGEQLVDHLHDDLSPDRQVRPNQLFAARLLPADQRAKVIGTVVRELTYPYGVSSLSPADSQFHPYHVCPAYYPKDAAYHNGTVWTWLAGPLISELVGHDALSTAWVLTDDAVRQILDCDAVGTQSELLDALPRPAQPTPRASGTVSQAWNLAEFVRNLYDDYLGIRVDELARRIRFSPRVPKDLDSIHATIMLPGGELAASAHADHSRGIALDLTDVDGDYLLTLDTGSGGTWEMVVEGGKKYAASVKDGKLIALPATPYHWTDQHNPAIETLHLGPLVFLVPRADRNFPVFRPLPYPLLSHGEVVTRIHDDHPVLVDAPDPAGDDRGIGACRGAYSYPLSSHFLPGSFDVLGLKVARDDSLCRFELSFKALSDPGWHPEYGFQLTFVAIAVDTASGSGGGSRVLRHNANYVLPPGIVYQRLILIGGGLQLEDADGRILGAYRPAEGDAVEPFARSEAGIIAFSLPLALIGTMNSSWSYAVYVGAQDDHGGAGLGEFRAVEERPSEWHGGGRHEGNCSNIYDDLYWPTQ